MKFGQKMMNLLSLARWPISNLKAEQICVNINFGANLTSSKTKIFLKCHFGRQNDGIWLKNNEPPAESCSLTHFKSKSCINLCESNFEWREIKRAIKQKFLKKMSFQRPKWWNLAEKRWASYGVLLIDPFPIEKLHKLLRIWILAQNKTSTETKKFRKKCHFRGQNDGIWPKNDEPTESCSLTHFQLKSCTNLCESEFRVK